MEGIFVIGAGGLGREVAWVLSESQHSMCAGFLDDNVPVGARVNNHNVVGCVEDFPKLSKKYHNSRVVCALGYPDVKEKLVNRADDVGAIWASLRHPGALTGDQSGWAEGCIVCAGSVVTVNVGLGKHVCILGATVGHDSTVGDFSTVCPNACISGYCTIEDRVFIGANATILPNIRIGSGAVVGAGAVVTKDVPPNATVVGVPARQVRV